MLLLPVLITYLRPAAAKSRDECGLGLRVADFNDFFTVNLYQNLDATIIFISTTGLKEWTSGTGHKCCFRYDRSEHLVQSDRKGSWQ